MFNYFLIYYYFFNFCLNFVFFGLLKICKFWWNLMKFDDFFFKLYKLGLIFSKFNKIWCFLKSYWGYGVWWSNFDQILIKKLKKWILIDFDLIWKNVEKCSKFLGNREVLYAVVVSAETGNTIDVLAVRLKKEETN